MLATHQQPPQIQWGGGHWKKATAIKKGPPEQVGGRGLSSRETHKEVSYLFRVNQPQQKNPTSTDLLETLLLRLWLKELDALRSSEVLDSTTWTRAA